MVIELEIKQEKIERRGGARANGGRKRLFSRDVPASRKQIVLPDEWWDSMKEMYPDTSFAMLIYRVLNEHSTLELTDKPNKL